MVVEKLWLKKDKQTRAKWKTLLKKVDLIPDYNVSYTVGIFEGEQLIATGSCFQNIIKCVAIDPDSQGEQLLSKIINALFDYLNEHDETHYFLYTKPSATTYFKSLGFSQIAETNNLAFMEYGLPNFQNYLEKIKKLKLPAEHAGSIVMNANPFTKGHLHLIKQAHEKCDVVYVFVLSDDSSEFSATNRFELVKKGVAYMENVVVIPTNSYIVSQATFPSYFLKDQADEEIAKVQARLDATVFSQFIAPALDIKERFVGEEPFSEVTEIYNQAMTEVFKGHLTLTIIPRLAIDDEVISATKIRAAFNRKNLEPIKNLVPETTYQFLEKELKKTLQSV
ncbi:MAG: [citrate (pro-3S)-lyase] ligase [Lactobacillales bacterium]|jgi:[citrate (pro-3S)-lyase] ligase|nr:[citrate (pro-3S)-lyase] ligase [Lactobacillales bacterium]